MTEAFKGWRLDKHVPIALVFAIGLQTAGIIWWASQMNSRVEHSEQAIVSLQQALLARDDLATRITRQETLMETMQSGVSRIENKIDRLVEQQRFPPR